MEACENVADLRGLMIMVDDRVPRLYPEPVPPVMIWRDTKREQASGDIAMFILKDRRCETYLDHSPDWYLALRSFAKSATYKQEPFGNPWGWHFSVFLNKIDAAMLMMLLGGNHEQ